MDSHRKSIGVHLEEKNSKIALGDDTVIGEVRFRPFCSNGLPVEAIKKIHLSRAKSVSPISKKIINETDKGIWGK